MNITEFKFKKGDEFKNNHLHIRYRNMYVSEEFVSLFGCVDIYNDRMFIPRPECSMTIQHNCFPYIKLIVYFYKLNTDNKYNYVVCGKSGDYGFGLNIYNGYKLGVRTQHKVFRFLINKYLKSNLCREEKLKQILDIYE